MSEQQVKFKPIYGPSERLTPDACPIVPGQILFETDTGKIFLDASSEDRISVGGSSSGASLYYSTQGQEGDTIEPSEIYMGYYLLNRSQLDADEDAKPKEDDLLICADGAFYRIANILENGDFLCTRMAISGSGGGGVITIEDTAILRTNSWKQNQTFIYGQDYFIEVGAHSDVDDYIDLAFLVTQNGEQVEAFTVSIANDTYYQFNTARLPKGTGISIQVQATSINSKMSVGPKNTITNLNTAELVINKSASFSTSSIITGDLSLAFLPKSNGLYQRLHVIIDDNEFDLNTVQADRPFLNFRPTNSDMTVIIPEQSHGIHNIELYTTVEISGSTLKSDSLFYEIAWRDPLDETPVIWIGEVPELVINYNEAIIPFMVYNPQTEADNQKTDVYLYYSDDGGVNFTELPTSPMQVFYTGGAWHQWDVTNIYKADEGAGKLNIFRLSVGGTVRDVDLYVTTDGSRDLGLVNENALLVNLNSVGRSNAETSLSRSNWASGTHAMEFNYFNWYNNGWLNNNDGRGSYLSVANGASARLNIGDLVLNNSSTNVDYSFEIRFRVRNIQEYSTLIRTIPYYFVNEAEGSYTVADIQANGYTIKKDDDGNMMMDAQASRKEISQNAGIVIKYLNQAGQGFCVGTQEAYFNTPGNIANVRYKEDEVINLSFVISVTSHLLSIYLNGILSGALDLSSVTS